MMQNLRSVLEHTLTRRSSSAFAELVLSKISKVLVELASARCMGDGKGMYAGGEGHHVYPRSDQRSGPFPL